MCAQITNFQSLRLHQDLRRWCFSHCHLLTMQKGNAIGDLNRVYVTNFRLLDSPTIYNRSTIRSSIPGCHYKFSIYLLHITWMWINNTRMYCCGACAFASCLGTLILDAYAIGFVGFVWFGIIFSFVSPAWPPTHGACAHCHILSDLFLPFLVACCVFFCCCCVLLGAVCFSFNFCVHPISI